LIVEQVALWLDTIRMFTLEQRVTHPSFLRVARAQTPERE
jgi:hypothetical protein